MHSFISEIARAGIALPAVVAPCVVAALALRRACQSQSPNFVKYSATGGLAMVIVSINIGFLSIVAPEILASSGVAVVGLWLAVRGHCDHRRRQWAMRHRAGTRSRY